MNMTPTDTLYSLLRDFVSNRMYMEQFCTLFANTFNLELDADDLTVKEYAYFKELARITYGYTDNEDEIAKLPQYYLSGKQVVEKVNEVCREWGISTPCSTDVCNFDNGESKPPNKPK